MVNNNVANRIHQIINHKTYNIFISNIDVAMQACGQKLDNDYYVNYYCVLIVIIFVIST